MGHDIARRWHNVALSTLIGLLAISQPAWGIDLSSAVELEPSEASVATSYAGFNRRNGQTQYRATVTNTSLLDFTGSLYLVIDSINGPVTVANADDTTTSGDPAFNLNTGTLAPGESVGPVSLFFQASGSRAPSFTFTTAVFLVPDSICTAGNTCDSGELGICSAGTSTCPDGPLGAEVCERNNDPVTEICDDNLDNDCDGEVDDADVCAPTCTADITCDTGEAGICSAGATACPDGPFGAPVCERVNDPVTEICDDNLDNDCDGEVDDADVCAPTCTVNTTCDTGEAGICSAGLTACPDGPSGAPVCERVNDPVAEICDDNLDNDCDGEVDDADVCGTPTCVAGAPCTTGEPGVCSEGAISCPAGPFGAPVCTGVTDPSVEICDGLDNDCDGVADEVFNIGGTCDTGDLGVCAPGVLACDGSGGTQCVADSEPQPEICNDGIDQDCDGSDCVLLSIDIEQPLANFVTSADTIDVTGTVDSNAETVVVNGVDATLGAGGFIATLPLRSGPNMLVAVATDADGNTGTDSVVVTRDIIAPNVQINSPPDGFQAIVDRVTVTGIVNDIVTGGMTPQVTVNGIEAFVQQGTFMVTDVPLVRGPNTITAIGTDSVGNTGTAQIDVSFDPPAGAKLQPFSGDGQAGLVGATLPEPLVVQVVDNAGNALASRVVRFEVTRSDGLLSSATQTSRMIEIPTDGAGLASVMLMLGDRSGEGNNQVRASSVGASGEAIFCATAQPALPDKILAVMGENQKGLAGSPLAEPFEVLVVDVSGNPIAGQPVIFAVVAGGGNFDGLATKTLSTDADGVARAVVTLGPQEGVSNNVVEVDFDGNLGLPVTFIASSLVAGAPEDTRFAGVVLDNTNTPIPGALIHIEGSDGDVSTDAEGQFLLTGVPVGAIHLRIDASVSPRPQIFPVLQFEANTVAGRINRLPTGPARIPPLVSDVKTVGGASDVVLEMPGVPGLTLTVFANSTTFPDGSSTGLVSINQVHLDKVPMPPPSGTIFMPPAWTVQPPGVEFEPPAKITIPNDGLPPGRVIDIFQFDHDLNRFVNVGPGTTDEEGLLIVSDPGFGITKSGWGGCGQPQPPTTCASSCNDGNRCTSDTCILGVCVHIPLVTLPSAANMCEGCLLGFPIDKKTDAECCADDSVTGNPVSSAGTNGWVVCCNGAKTVCNKPYPPSYPLNDVLSACDREHEAQHFGDIDCPSGSDECDTSRPNFKPGRDPQEAECDAYTVTIQCLRNHNCMGVQACQDNIDFYVMSYQTAAMQPGTGGATCIIP